MGIPSKTIFTSASLTADIRLPKVRALSKDPSLRFASVARAHWSDSMLHGVIDTPPALKLARPYRLPRAKALLVAMCVSLALVALAAWATARPALADLGNPHTLHSSGLHSAWSKGSVIVVIRHAERCDRSRGACLDDPTGITLAGSRVAADVG